MMMGFFWAVVQTKSCDFFLEHVNVMNVYN